MINAKHFLYQGCECTQLLGGPILISDFATLFRSRIMPLDLCYFIKSLKRNMYLLLIRYNMHVSSVFLNI